MSIELPKLPEPAGVIVIGTQALRAFTANQVEKARQEAARLALERVEAAVTALRDSHCAGTGYQCTHEDNSCDFVAAWNDAIAAIRSLLDSPPGAGQGVE